MFPQTKPRLSLRKPQANPTFPQTKLFFDVADRVKFDKV